MRPAFAVVGLGSAPYGFFAALDDLVITGPTHANVNDFRAPLAL
jgi:glycerate-2-kinase